MSETTKRIETDAKVWVSGKEFILSEYAQTVAASSFEQGALSERNQTIEGVKELIDKYWRFDNYQEPQSSWHEKQYFLKELDKLKV